MFKAQNGMTFLPSKMPRTKKNVRAGMNRSESYSTISVYCPSEIKNEIDNWIFSDEKFLSEKP